MEESESEGLDELVFARKDTFLKDVDYVCISDNYWLGKTKPCITYGLRGICYFSLEVKIVVAFSSLCVITSVAAQTKHGFTLIQFIQHIECICFGF